MGSLVADYPRFNSGIAALELRAAHNAVEWALPLITEAAAHAVRRHGDWSVARNLAHLVVYEERIAVPVLGALADGEDGSERVISGDEGWLARDAEQLGAGAFSAIRERYEAVVSRHLELLGVFDDASFNEPHCSLWQDVVGVLVPAGWVSKKSSQHLWEHGHVLIRAGWVAYAPRTA